ncbi:MAG: ATP-dependent Clp protease proteolytic subunit [Planctomycetota bacterium]
MEDLNAIPEEVQQENNEEESSGKTPKMSLPARELLEKHRTIFISETVSPKLSKRIIPQLLWLDTRSDDPIRLFINTPGGSADDGFAIHDTIRFVRSPVLSICTGLNASAGTVILLASTKERRFALPNCRIMLHQPAGGIRGKASDIEVTAEEIIKLRERTNRLIAQECGRTVEEVEKDTSRDCWFSPEEALEYGLIGKILKSLNEL